MLVFTAFVAPRTGCVQPAPDHHMEDAGATLFKGVNFGLSALIILPFGNYYVYLPFFYPIPFRINKPFLVPVWIFDL